MYKSPEEFEQKLITDLQGDHSKIGLALEIISKLWQESMEAESKRRDSESRHALDMLLATFAMKIRKKLFSNTECCGMIGSLDAVYGISDEKNCSNGSILDKKLLHHFAKSCQALGWKPDDNYVDNIRDKKEFLEAIYKYHLGEIK